MNNVPLESLNKIFDYVMMIQSSVDLLKLQYMSYLDDHALSHLNRIDRSCEKLNHFVNSNINDKKYKVNMI